MKRLKIAVVSPGGTFEKNNLAFAHHHARSLGMELIHESEPRLGSPAFLNGSKEARLRELLFAENLNADVLWCARGGCGAVELWHGYGKEFYKEKNGLLIGYSDNTILHFARFLRAERIGIHGPIFLDLLHDHASITDSLTLLINKQAQNLSYPALRSCNHFLATKLFGELIVMNLSSLQSIVGGFDANFMRGKILALEDVNEPHYKVFRKLHQLKNIGMLTGLKALIVGHFGDERENIIRETFLPIADELGIPLFDWPIFGHEKPNWPLLFGAKATIKKVDERFFTLTYDEQHDHTPIRND